MQSFVTASNNFMDLDKLAMHGNKQMFRGPFFVCVLLSYLDSIVDGLP